METNFQRKALVPLSYPTRPLCPMGLLVLNRLRLSQKCIGSRMACQKIAQGREDINLMYKAVSIHKNVRTGLVYLHSLLYSLFLVCVIFWHAIPTSLLIFLYTVETDTPQQQTPMI